MSRGVTGIAGVGQGRNLDRAKPAVDGPAMVASTSARREESVQEASPGAALSPAAPALVRRSRAGADMAGAALEAEPMVEVATSAGAQQPSQLAANASAALTPADADAAQGPVTAARGVTDVDLGPTRVVSEGGTSRASGGGQSATNFETDSTRIARDRSIGGAPLAAIAATTEVDVPTAPPSEAGGQPATPQTNVQPTAVVRAEVGGRKSLSGGPAMATDVGPPTEISMAEQVAGTALGRAELAEALIGKAAIGGGDAEDEEDEKERERRLARTANRTGLAAAPVTADSSDAPVGVGDADGPSGAAEAPTIARATTEATDGGPEAGMQQSGSVVELPTVVASQTARRVRPEGTAVASISPSPISRSADLGPSSPKSLFVEPAGIGPATEAAAGQAGDIAASIGAAAPQSADESSVTAIRGQTRSVDVEGGAQRSVPRSRLAQARIDTGATASFDSASPQRTSNQRTGSGSITTAGDAADMSTAAEGGAMGDGANVPAITADANPVARADVDRMGSMTGGPADVEAAAASDTVEEFVSLTVTQARATEGPEGRATGSRQPDLDLSRAVTPRIAQGRASVSPPWIPAGRDAAHIATSPATALAASGGAAGVPVAGPDAGPVAASATLDTAGRTAASGWRSDESDDFDVGRASGASGGDLLAPAMYARAETLEGTIGSPHIGGGTGSPTRLAVGPTAPADIYAPALALDGSPVSGGTTDGSLIASQGAQPARLPSGANSPPAHGLVGALAGDRNLDVVASGNKGLVFGTRYESPSDEPGTTAGHITNQGARLKRSSLTSLPSGSEVEAPVDLPRSGSSGLDEPLRPYRRVGDATGIGELAQKSTQGGLAVNVDAASGPGGIGAEYAFDSGLNNRRARRESMQVQVRTTRFVRQQVGGLPDFSTAAVVAAEPFRRRGDRNAGGDMGDGHGGTPPPQTEETIELGLSWLARQQLPDGSWSLQGINGEKSGLVTDTAATGLALLAFQGAGYSHREHKYADVVNGGIRYLLANQKEDGDLFIPMDDESNRSVWFYSHSIAVLALCESYGMTQDPELREPIQKAIDFLVKAQHPKRGGWRYSPQYGSDMSVTGWAMMALKSGQLANLKVPDECFAGIRRWLDRCQGSASERHLYRYNPYAPDTEEQRHGRAPNKTMTSVGLLMRLYLDWRRDNEHMIDGARYLTENPPSIGSARNPQRDTYYWYYATQVMFHMGGDYWKAWNGRLHPLLVNTQVKRGSMAGSWDPRGPVPDRWAPHAGRLYVTSMNLLSLEVYYRHLPLYEDYAK